MSVEARGSVHLPVSPARLWERLSDPAQLATALPDVESVSYRDGASLRAVVHPRTGLGTTPLDLEVEVLEKTPERGVRLAGRGRGTEFEVDFELTIELADLDRECGVEWQGRVDAKGGVGALLQRVLPMLFTDQVEAVLRAAAESAPAG